MSASKAGLLRCRSDDGLVAQKHLHQLDMEGGSGDAQLALKCCEDLDHGRPCSSQLQVKRGFIWSQAG